MHRGVLIIRLGMGYFCGLITRQSQERTRLQYDYVHLEDDRSTRSMMKLRLEKCTADPAAVKGSWVLLEEIRGW